MKTAELANSLKGNIGKVIIGKDEQITLITAAMLTGGNVLIEDVPGTGKTMLAKSLALSVGCSFKRIQFTPDLLPGDLTGITYYNPKESEFIFRRGAVFANILLADEINRATPRTQSALLEAMEEKQVTVDGTTYTLEQPFFVIATQNPIETAGTYPLPEAQLDRFAIRLSLGYPSADEYLKIFSAHGEENPLDSLKSVCTGEDILAAAEECRGVYIHNDLLKYIIELAEATRTLEGVALGLSTRGVLCAAALAKAYAAVNGRDFVTPEDIKHTFPYAASHRLILSGSYRYKRNYAAQAIAGLLSTIAVPTEEWSRR